MSVDKPARRLAEAALFVGLLALFIVPFVLFEERMLAWVAWLRGSDLALATVGAAFTGLLIADILAPVPSSLVGVALGSTFGAAGGTLLCWLGLMGGVFVGYAAGRRVGRPLVRAAAGPGDLQVLERLVARHGLWALVLLRPVPVLAEASVIVAGAAGYRVASFAGVMALSNLGIALVYAQLGALGMGAGSMMIGLAGAIGVPLVAWLVSRLFARIRPDSRPARGSEPGALRGPD